MITPFIMFLLFEIKKTLGNVKFEKVIRVIGKYSLEMYIANDITVKLLILLDPSTNPYSTSDLHFNTYYLSILYICLNIILALLLIRYNKFVSNYIIKS